MKDFQLSKLEHHSKNLKETSTKKNLWIFHAYKSEERYKRGDFFFERVFNSHVELKVFSANFATSQRSKYHNFCSTYWKLVKETNLINKFQIKRIEIAKTKNDRYPNS